MGPFVAGNWDGRLRLALIKPDINRLLEGLHRTAGNSSITEQDPIHANRPFDLPQPGTLGGKVIHFVECSAKPSPSTLPVSLPLGVNHQSDSSTTRLAGAVIGKWGANTNSSSACA